MSYAQGSKRGGSSRIDTQETNKACLKLIAEAEAKDKEIAVLRADKADLEIIKGALTDKVKLLEKIIELSEKDLSKLQKAGSLDAQAIGKLEAQRDQFREELARTRKERDSARSLLRKVGGACLVVGLAVGAGAVLLLKRN